MTTELQNKILTKCKGAEVWQVGAWTWVMFPKKPEQAIRDEMKLAGGFFNGRRKVWQFSNGVASKHSSKENGVIFNKYGVEAQTLSTK